MGIQDRDYVRERTIVNARTTHHSSYFSSLIGSITGKIVFAIVLGFLVLAALGDANKKGQGCRVAEFVLDQNQDGKVTYRDLQAAALKIIEIPIKLVMAQEKAKTFTHFLEIARDQCRTTRAMVISGVLAFTSLSVIVITASVALWLLRKIAKLLIFNLFKVSPFGSWNSRLFKFLHPGYQTLIDLRYIALLAGGLTVIWLAKNQPDPTIKVKPLPAQKSSAQTPKLLEKNTKILASNYVEIYRNRLPELKKIDALVAEVDVQKFNTVDALANALTKGLESDLEKTYAIYKWVTSNIEYDVDAYFSNNLRGIGSAQVVLKNRKAVCDGYSELMMRLGRASGLVIEKIGGFAKGYGYAIGESMTKPNHAWNVVKIDDRWYLLDSTWDAGSVSKESRKFIKNSGEFQFFLVNPSYFIYSHYPEDKKWQLLSDHWTKEEFFSKVTANEKAFRLGLMLENHSTSIIRIPNNQYIFDFRSSTPITGALRSGDSRVEGNWTLPVFDQEGKVRLMVSAPDRGAYNLFIFAQNANLVGQFSGLLEYKIIFDKNGQPFPEVFGFYYKNKVGIKTPIYDNLSSDRAEPFNLRVPGAQSVHIYQNGKSIHVLDKDGDIFTGEVSLSRGEAMVFAEFSREGKLDGLLKYRIQ
jgi:hypothetical protein